MATINPSIVAKDGRTIRPTGVEWLVAFAIQGCDWAVKALEELEKKHAGTTGGSNADFAPAAR